MNIVAVCIICGSLLSMAVSLFFVFLQLVALCLEIRRLRVDLSECLYNIFNDNENFHNLILGELEEVQR